MFNPNAAAWVRVATFARTWAVSDETHALARRGYDARASGVGASGWRAADPIPAHADGVAVKHSRNDAFDWLHDSIRQFGMLRCLKLDSQSAWQGEFLVHERGLNAGAGLRFFGFGGKKALFANQALSPPNPKNRRPDPILSVTDVLPIRFRRTKLAER